MAPKPNQKSGKIKVGICTNKQYVDPNTDETIECPKCASGERLRVEVSRPSDFVCPVCGEKLTPVKEQPKWIIPAIIAAVVGIIIAVVLIIWPTGDKNQEGGTNPTGVGQEQIDTLKKDSTETEVVTAPENTSGTEIQTEGTGGGKEDPAPVVKEPTAGAANSLSGYSLPYGRYSGPAKNGVPDGLEGEVVVTKSYSLDLHNGSSLELANGDKITRCKFKNGKLVSGMLNRPDGTSRTFNIGVN